MDHREVMPLKSDEGKLTGFFAKAKDADEHDFARAVAERYWVWLRHSVKPPLKEQSEREVAELVADVTGLANIRYNPSSERYVVTENRSSGSFEAYIVYARDIVKESREAAVVQVEAEGEVRAAPTREAGEMQEAEVQEDVSANVG